MQISFWLRRMMMLYSKIDALQIIFTSSQTYTIDSKYKSVDVFMVGNGGTGGTGSRRIGTSEDRYFGGGGGGGGYTKTEKLITLSNTNLSVIIGTETKLTYNGSTELTVASGTDGDTNANGGNGGSGGGNGGYGYTGSGARANGYNGGSNGGNGGVNGHGGIGQGTTTRAYGEADGTLYAGGGGGGAQQWIDTNPGEGGDGGGANGGSPTQRGSSASANTGGGGGGGGSGTSGNTGKDGGNGGSGIIIVRLYRSNKRPTDIDWSDKTINL